MMLAAIFSNADRLDALREAERTFQMNEEAFLAFYEETARPLWRYLSRTTGDPRLADDLLQETYYRFLRAKAPLQSDDHRRHYLFRIATNLVSDRRRRPTRETELDDQSSTATSQAGAAMDGEGLAVRRLDLARAMARLTPRERSLLWLAYTQGLSHAEIASVVGVKAASMKVLLYRARRRLTTLLQRTRQEVRS